MKQRATIPVFIPEEACPHRCVFCNQHHITGKAKAPSTAQVKKIIEEHLVTLKGIPHLEVAFFGGSFTGIPIRQQQEYLEIVRSYIERGIIHSIRISTRPDYITKEILAVLKSGHVRTIELGAQSLDEEVLRLSGRGHSVEDVENAALMINAHGFDLGLQMMTGLPGDTPQKSEYTAKRIIDLGAKNTRIYPTLVVKDTDLEILWRSGDYEALTIEQAIEFSIKPYLLFEEAGVEIIRVGLHPSEGFLSGDDLLAGPFHVAFRELLLTEVWKRVYLKIDCTEIKNAITLVVPEDELQFAVGHGGSNKKMLRNKFRHVNYVPIKRLEFPGCSQVFSLI